MTAGARREQSAERARGAGRLAERARSRGPPDRDGDRRALGLALERARVAWPTGPGDRCPLRKPAWHCRRARPIATTYRERPWGAVTLAAAAASRRRERSRGAVTRWQWAAGPP